MLCESQLFSCQHLPIGYRDNMGYTHTHYYETIIQRQIRAGRASNKSEVIHQALALLDAVTQGRGPAGASFRSAEDLETLLLQVGPVTAMTAERKARIYGRLKR